MVSKKLDFLQHLGVNFNSFFLQPTLNLDKKLSYYKFVFHKHLEHCKSNLVMEFKFLLDLIKLLNC